MKRKVTRDFDLVIGGPMGPRKVAATFRVGETLIVRRVSALGEYPKMYKIVGRPHLGQLSRGVLTQFLRGFEPRTKLKGPEP